jgi:hypothetical protein
MSPTQNTTVIFNEIPKGAPDANTLIVDDKATIDLDGPLNGGFIVKTLCFSLDPYMRGRMRDPSIKSYVPAFELHKPYVLSRSRRMYIPIRHLTGQLASTDCPTLQWLKYFAQNPPSSKKAITSTGTFVSEPVS